MTDKLQPAEIPVVPPGGIDELLQFLVDQANQGEAIDIDSVCRQNPQWANELRVVLPALLLFDHSRKFVSQGTPARFDSEHGRRIANYRIGRVIGRGGMGVVYEATQSPLGRRVAIKLLKDVEATPLARRRFEQEFRIAASLHHTNIVPVFDAGEDNGQLYFAMQYIDGVQVSQWQSTKTAKYRGATLAAVDDSTAQISNSIDGVARSGDSGDSFVMPSRQKNEVDFQLVALLGVQVAAALQFAHEKGILHRDIKPANILIDAGNNAWVTDFGLARPIDSENLTESGDIAGTIRYLAPERLQGKCDCRSDIYALGLVLLELVTQRPAWDGLSGPVLVKKLAGGETCPFPSGTELPTDLRLIIQKAIQPHPEMRYLTAREMSEDLTRFIEARPITARRFSYLHSTILWARRNPTVAALWTTTILTLIGGTVIASILALNWQSAATQAAKREQEVIIEKDRATESLQLTRSSVEQMTAAIADRYYSRQIPLTELDRQNLNQILEYYDQLDSLESTGTLTSASKAHGLRVVSGIRYKLGQIEQAKQDMLDSVAIFRALLTEIPDSVDLRVGLADGLLQLGIYESENHERGNGLELFLAAKKEFLDLPTSPDVQMKIDDGLQTVFSNIGTIHFLEQRWAEAEDYFEQAIGIQRSLVARDPGRIQYQHSLAKSMSNLVLCLIETRQIAEAEAAAAESTTLHLKIVEQDDSPENRFVASVSWVVQGKVNLLGGKLEDAFQGFQEAERIANLLVADYPSVPKYRYHWSSTLGELASYCSDTGNDEGAIEFHTREVENRRQVVAEVPDQVTFRGGLAESLDFLATRLSENQPEQAIEHWEESIRHFDEIVRTRPELLWAHEERNNVTVRMAFCYKNELQNLDAALALLIQARTTWESLADQWPAQTQFRLWQCGTGRSAGLILFEQGKKGEALAMLQEALAVAESILPDVQFYSNTQATIASIKAAIERTESE